MPLGVGWQGCQLHTHIHTPPTFAILLPHALFPGQFTLSPRFWFCFLLTHRFWGVFGLMQVSTLQFRVLHVGGSFSRRKLLSVGLSRTGNSWLYPRGFSSADSPIVRPCLSSRVEERAVFPRFCWLWIPTVFWAAGYLW